ncbi:MAG: hypothetical protein MJA31_19955, partial [Clostridia bacterium]|nr:hypothetical protein [Clostridia bacterium]
MNKDYSKILIIFLIVNLIASLNVSNRLNALRKQEIHTSTYFEQTVEEELEMIQDKIEELREGLKWITDVEISLETNKKETQTIKFNWQIKDYNADSKVAFFYKFLNEDFVEIPVTYKT